MPEFYFFGIMNNAAMNRVYRYPTESLLSILWVYTSEVDVESYNNFLIIIVKFIVCP